MNPRTLSKEKFVRTFGGVYEHSPWIAEQTYPVLSAQTSEVNARQLADIMSRIMQAAKPSAQLELIRAHPDLAGRAAIAGKLTEASTFEQTGAGLDQCSPQEFAQFTELNTAYTDKFDFPFIIAVKGHDRRSILQTFTDRLQHDPATEFREALRQIDKIARFRIEEIFK